MYPPDFVLTKPYADDPNRYLVFLHCIGILYMLLGLNTVCDVYFTGALEVMVDEWKIKPDVAGATFMAAGGSAPELFTSLIGATVESDVGFSTIVGSAVFNVLFVIGLCGYYAKEEMVLTWFPLFRDCSYYIFGLVLLAIFSSDTEIQLHESLILFGCYIIYCTMMYNNSTVEALVDSRLRKALKQVAPAESYPDDDRSLEASSASTVSDTAKKLAQLKGEALEAENGNDVPETTPEMTPEVSPEEAESGDSDCKERSSDGDDDDDDEHFMTKPEGVRDQIIWYLSLPVYWPLFMCTPEPSKKWFLATFITSLCWIAGFSFLLVWWVEIVGDIVFNGNQSASIIMGFTVLAAGTSIPDAVSSVAVARQGEGDMAVSSSIGSNIFDILVGLPIPWTIKILMGIASGGKTEVTIGSPFLFFYVVLLLFMVCLTVCSIHMLGWRLNWKLGIMMAALYGVFLTLALTAEFAQFEWLKWGNTR